MSVTVKPQNQISFFFFFHLEIIKMGKQDSERQCKTLKSNKNRRQIFLRSYLVEFDYDYENTHTVVIRRFKKIIFSCVITQFDHSKLTLGEKEICLFVFLLILLQIFDLKNKVMNPHLN